jgi:hypothetical protein
VPDVDDLPFKHIDLANGFFQQIGFFKRSHDPLLFFFSLSSLFSTGASFPAIVSSFTISFCACFLKKGH